MRNRGVDSEGRIVRGYPIKTRCQESGAQKWAAEDYFPETELKFSPHEIEKGWWGRVGEVVGITYHWWLSFQPALQVQTRFSAVRIREDVWVELGVRLKQQRQRY